MTSMKPLVSVIVPVYNGAAYLAESIESILSQSFKNFELIVINDGSKDNSEEVIQKFLNDPRVKYVRQKNMGLAKTLNVAIEMAEGDLIARQDQDDISFANRLEKQVRLFGENPDVGLIGGGAEIIDVSGKQTGRSHRNFTEDGKIKAFLIFDNPIFHSSVMFRKSLFESVGKYSWILERQPEDYDLWSRMALSSRVLGIEEAVIQYRETPGSMSRINEEPFPQMYNITRAYISTFLELSEKESLQWALWVHRKSKLISPILVLRVAQRLKLKNGSVPVFFWRRILSLLYRNLKLSI